MATYSLPNSADCCESDGILKCPDTLCGDCDNYINCEEHPNDPSCWCSPEEDFRWNGQDSVDWVFHYWDYYREIHTSNSFQNGSMPWYGGFCGYQLGGYIFYYLRDHGWIFVDFNGHTWEPNGHFGNIFTRQGNDFTNSSYYEIL